MTAGWPRSLVPPQHEEFGEQVVIWLLDQGPSSLRQSPLRHYPIALCAYVQAYAAGAVDGVRKAYGKSRTAFAGHLQAADLEIVQQAMATEGARLVALQRELDLVAEVLLTQSNDRTSHRMTT
ncbi:MAG: hypothetical protein Q7L55_00720 [Actinomycetota bacterium]|nr:hypothetical protein [Actinomycetota bacterium]